MGWNIDIRYWIMEWSRIGAIAILIALLTGIDASAQVAPNTYIVYFSDKDNTPYSINQPAEFLSTRALERRAAQGIDIETSDLPVDPNYVQQVTAIEDVTLLHELRWFNAITIEASEEAIEEVMQLSMVSQVKSSRILERYGDEKTTKKAMSRAKASMSYGPSFTQIDMLNGIPLHDEGYLGGGMQIAVLDGGFFLTQQADVLDPLWENDQIVGVRDFVGVPDDSVFTASTHGTSVLSTMGGFMPDSLIGTAPEAEYYLLKSENTVSEYEVEEANWAAAAQYADSVGADIINVSLSYTTFDDSTLNHTYEDLDGQSTLVAQAANIAASKGMLVVVSAGNYADNDWTYIGTPADAPGVLTVGAVDENEEYVSFSSIGPTADGRIKPDVMAMGLQTVLTDLNTGIGRGNGTSFSAPVMCGMAACLWQKHPNATPEQLRQAIRESAHLYEMPNDSMGYGIPDFELADSILQNVLGVPEPPEEGQYSIWPNPFDEMLVIRTSGDVIERVELSNAEGKIIADLEPWSDMRTIRMNLPKTLAPGIYFARIYSGGSVSVEKVIKAGK